MYLFLEFNLIVIAAIDVLGRCRRNARDSMYFSEEHSVIRGIPLQTNRHRSGTSTKMPPSVALIRFNALVTALKTITKHYTSRSYPPEWDLRFHIQFAILRNLLEGTGNWTIEEVIGKKGRN